MTTPAERAGAFCRRFGMTAPILLAPMAGVGAPGLSAAVISAGGMGALGALLLEPAEIGDWVRRVRAAGDGPFQLNLWVPEPAPTRDPEREAAVRAFLSQWGPTPAVQAGDAVPPDFFAQFEALLAASPAAVSSVMGLFPAENLRRAKAKGIAWFATVTTLDEAKRAEEAGADVIVAQGMEAGGHRGAFAAIDAERDLVGLFSLVPAVADAVTVPVVAS
ncbi:MAG: nitronate monooxygenase, partial [Caulobacteraceae bacterium]